MKNYVTDFVHGWRPLFAATLGLSGGMSLNPFVSSIFAPHLVAAMGWSKATFAMTGSISGLSILIFPIVGLLADRYGTRRLALVGLGASALSYALMSQLNGSIGFYAALLVLQIVLGAATTGPVYLRLIVQNFTRTRGGAIAFAVSGPPMIAVVGSPLLSHLIAVQGWRAAYLAMTAYTIVVSGLAVMLAPHDKALAERAAAKTDGGQPVRRAEHGFLALLANPVFRRLIGITFLLSLPIAITNAQLALVLVWKGLSPLTAGNIISFFAAGVIVGRIAVGVALDRFEAEVVGALSFCLPVTGMLLLASPLTHVAVMMVAVLLVGLAVGAEGDLLTYIVVKHVGLGTYSTGLGLLFAALGMASLFGALALSASLRLTDGYAPFLIGAACLTLVGCILLYRIRHEGKPATAQSVSLELKNADV